MSHPRNLFEQMLLEKLKADDREAFSIIFSKYYRDLVHFSFLITRNNSAAEELVQDVFLKMWESRSSLEIRSSLKSYLLTSVQNKSIDFLRHQQIEKRYFELCSESPVLFSRDTENYVLLSELEDQFAHALARIPAQFAEAYRLSRMEGLNYHEISARLEVSERTVEVRVSRALQMLREELKEYL